jgi:hypothetical protein
MISQKLLHILETHQEDIAGRWLKDVKQHLDTISYKKIPDDKLRESAVDLFAHMAPRRDVMAGRDLRQARPGLPEDRISFE